MKNTTSKRILVTLLTFAFVLSALSPCVAFAAGTQPSALDVVFEYMDARHVLFSTGDTSDLEGIAVAAIVTDELAHRQLLGEEDITLPDVRYVIDSVNAWDNYILVEMREIEEIVFIGEPSFEVSHTILIQMDQNQNPLVVSDNYMEGLSGFESCSYAPEYVESDVELNIVVNSSKCFLRITNTQVGYKEKASDYQLDSFTANEGDANYTKYGAWYGANGVPWCAIFVSWCANQANVPTSVIPCVAYVPYLCDHFQGQGNYYASASEGGSYTPKAGDIFFTTDENHTGIVYCVYDSYMTVIDGNWGGEVAKRNIALTSSNIIGYGSPNYATTEHIWDGSSGIQHCINCGAPKSTIIE